MVQSYSRGNDFEKKNFRQTFFGEKFSFKPIPEEMILQPKTFSTKKFSMKNFGLNLFRGNEFATIKNVR